MLEKENRALQLENVELKMERDMLKKQQPTLRKTKVVYDIIESHPEYSAAKWVGS